MSHRNVLIGYESGGSRVTLDLDTVLRTRLLIQANSGGGKSWLLRRLAEQLFGRIPVLIIDPEGEFATLREKYGYVLAAKGGDTPADVRSAEILAQRLLELRASAVCDLYEMKPGDRHEWVRRFLNALIDAPKKLWGPLIVIVDEAHLFCPEKGAGESAAAEAMTALTTRGRKRGYCPIWATQRLAKLRKDAAAELQNVLIGPTFMDADRERAADALGVAKGDRKAFFDQIKLLPEGQFFGLGRAIALDRVLVKVGPVDTTHPEPGSTKHAAAPPPPPEKVKALLPKLADLPAEAEAKERTVTELKAEVHGLKRKLSEAERLAASALEAAVPEKKIVERCVVKTSDLARSEKLVARLEAAADRLSSTSIAVGAQAARLADAIASAKQPPPARGAVPAVAAPPARASGGSPVARRGSPSAAGGATLPRGGAEQRVLDALAELEDLGVRRPERPQVALLAGYTNLASKGLVNAMGALRTAGLIDYPEAGRVSLTDTGRAQAASWGTPRTVQEVQDRIVSLLGGASARILAPLISSYPKPVAREEVANAAGYGNLASKGFVNAIGRLRSLGFIDYPSSGMIVAKPVLFMEGA